MPETTFITDPEELETLLELPEPVDRLAAAALPLRIPRELAKRIGKGDPNDPILLQFRPSARENDSPPGFGADPLKEWSGPATGETFPAGLLWKYAGRVLVMTRGVCAAHCRFCFRRHLPPAAPLDWGEIAAFLERNRSVGELILSGGDPLGMPTEELDLALHYIKGLSFVKWVRIHTRHPILAPSLLAPDLIPRLKEVEKSGKRFLFVFHINHPAELTPAAARAVGLLRRAGFPLFSQTVLLRGVNDRTETLAELLTRAFEAGIVPYYLHQLDRVAGAAHFEVPVEEGRRIVARLRALLPGYLVPRYVREIPGAPSKIPLEPAPTD
ncbi:MAG: KamA family radical SAM protein [Thermoguttaceae bacterium]|nr:KamA family radical SAM protein [Thermoguttaceae bacterium]